MSTLTASRQVLGLLAWLGITFVAAALGAVGSLDAGEFYAQLARPTWAPPAGVFAPVWTILYLMMGVAAWLVWRTRGWHTARAALVLYLVQLAFNTLWSWLFFTWHLGAIAFADVLLLWCLILLMLIAFWRISTVTGLLCLPYLLWVSFALALNYAVWQMNPTRLG